jgi:hypothetical protein
LGGIGFEVMKKKISIAIVVMLATLAQLCCSEQRIECEKIAQRTESLLKERQLDHLYASLSHSAKSSTSKAEFDERANRVIAALQRVDETLSFTKVREGGVNPDGFADLYYEFRAVGSGTNKLDVEITIDLNGGPRLFDVCVRPTISPTSDSENCLTNALRKI